MAREISPYLVRLPDGVSEYCFAGLYLFRDRYDYRVSIRNCCLIVSGKRDGKRFFLTPCCSTGMDTIDELTKDDGLAYRDQAFAFYKVDQYWT